MKCEIGKCYFKNGKEMPKEHKAESIEELTELLNKVCSRTEQTVQQESTAHEKTSA